MASDRVLAAALVLTFSVAVLAEEAAAPEAPTSELRYIELQPSFVTNFGGPSDGHLMYLRADVTVTVNGIAGASAAKYHSPALRHAMVMLLSSQEEADVATNTGRERIREQALTELRAILETEEGAPFIEDLLFTNFIVQR